MNPGDIILPRDGRFPVDALRVLSVDADGAVNVARLGGGLVRHIDATALHGRGFRPVTDADKKASPWAMARFHFDGDSPFYAWTNGSRWNGWAVPSFELDGFKAWLDGFDGMDSWAYDEAEDTFVLNVAGQCEPWTVRGEFVPAVGATLYRVDGFTLDVDA